MTYETPHAPGLSRRRFIQVSLVTVGGLSLGGLSRGAQAGAQAPAGATTLTQVLEARPSPLPDGSTPFVLLQLARDAGRTPEELVDSYDEEIGEDARSYLRMLDARFPYQTPFGQQPLDAREGALEWAEREREQLPDLGPRRPGGPDRATPSASGDPASPDEPWRLVAVLILDFSASVATALTVPVEQQPDSPESGATSTISPADAAALSKEP